MAAPYHQVTQETDAAWLLLLLLHKGPAGLGAVFTIGYCDYLGLQCEVFLFTFKENCHSLLC